MTFEHRPARLRRMLERGVDAPARKHLGAAAAEIAVRGFDELDGFRHRYQSGCLRGREDPGAPQTQTWST